MHATDQLFVHIRVVMGIVLGLGLTHLLRQAARFVVHPHKARLWWVHLVWMAYLFLYLVHFWWWEFQLDTLTHWTYATYLFLILYTVLLFLLCALLVPEDISDYAGFRDYFMQRRLWFFGAMTAMYVLDVIDTWVKGAAYAHSLGPEYAVRRAIAIPLCLIAMRTRNRYYHAGFAVLALAYQIAVISRLYQT